MAIFCKMSNFLIISAHGCDIEYHIPTKYNLGMSQIQIILESKDQADYLTVRQSRSPDNVIICHG